MIITTKSEVPKCYTLLDIHQTNSQTFKNWCRTQLGRKSDNIVFASFATNRFVAVMCLYRQRKPLFVLEALKHRTFRAFVAFNMQLCVISINHHAQMFCRIITSINAECSHQFENNVPSLPSAQVGPRRFWSYWSFLVCTCWHLRWRSPAPACEWFYTSRWVCITSQARIVC